MFVASKSGDFVAASRSQNSSRLASIDSGNQERQRTFTGAANTIISSDFALASERECKRQSKSQGKGSSESI
jgi:hypothetical protein